MSHLASDPVALAALGTGFTFLCTALGAAVVFFVRRELSPKLGLGFLGFASGVMMAASVWSLLIPAIEMAEEQGKTGWVPALGGFVLGAFADGALKGFTSVESAPLGKAGDYRDLTCLHVSAELRGRGVGRELFTRAAQWARAHGGKKLYLSAHSAVETQAFYAAMGCVEAREYNEAHVASEPFDCQMEYAL